MYKDYNSELNKIWNNAVVNVGEHKNSKANFNKIAAAFIDLAHGNFHAWDISEYIDTAYNSTVMFMEAN